MFQCLFPPPVLSTSPLLFPAFQCPALTLHRKQSGSWSARQATGGTSSTSSAAARALCPPKTRTTTTRATTRAGSCEEIFSRYSFTAGYMDMDTKIILQRFHIAAFPCLMSGLSHVPSHVPSHVVCHLSVSCHVSCDGSLGGSLPVSPMVHCNEQLASPSCFGLGIGAYRRNSDGCRCGRVPGQCRTRDQCRELTLSRSGPDRPRRDQSIFWSQALHVYIPVQYSTRARVSLCENHAGASIVRRRAYPYPRHDDCDCVPTTTTAGSTLGAREFGPGTWSGAHGPTQQMPGSEAGAKNSNSARQDEQARGREMTG